MKEGYYTTINGNEYKIDGRICSETSQYETILITYDEEAADDTFVFDEGYHGYVKVVDSDTIIEKHRYSISYFYKGCSVGKLGSRDNNITIFLDYKDKDIAKELGFREFDRISFIKDVDISEVEMKQEGPF